MSDKMNRRKFLKLAGTAVAAASAAGLLAGCEDEPASSSRPASSGSSSSSSSSTTEEVSNQNEVVWKIEDCGNGEARLIGWDKTGKQPMGSIRLPDKVSGRTIREVAAELGDGITKLTIPGTVKTVYQLKCPNLRTAVIEEGVEQLGSWEGAWVNSPFGDCKYLSNVSLPSSLKVIERCCFENCTSLQSIRLPAKLETIGISAFAGSGLTDITVPASVKKFVKGTVLANDCFRNTPLKSATLLCKVTGSYMFEGCKKLTKVTLNNDITTLEWGIFKECTSLQTVVLPAGIKELPYQTFYGCTSLTKIEIPEAVTAVGEGALQQCMALTKLRIPPQVTELSSNVLRDCVSLSAIYLPGGLKTISSNAVEGCKKLLDVYYGGSEEQWSKISANGSTLLNSNVRLHENAYNEYKAS